MSETGEPPEAWQEAAAPPPPAPVWTAPPAASHPAFTPPPPGWPAPGPAAPEVAVQASPAAGGNRGGIAAIIVAMVLLVTATVGSWIYVHGEHSSSSSTVRAVGGQQAGASNGSGASQGSSTAGPANGSPPTASNPYATPTPPPLDMGAVQRTMEAYLNAVQNHDLTATRSIVCPRFRSSYRGTYSPQGYAYSGWSAHYQDPVAGTNYAYVVVTQGLLDTRTGVKKGSETHSWYVERDDGTYYVCGFIA